MVSVTNLIQRCDRSEGFEFNEDEGRCTCPYGEAYSEFSGECRSTRCRSGTGQSWNYDLGYCDCPEGQCTYKWDYV